jgi:hypothetical protein
MSKRKILSIFIIIMSVISCKTVDQVKEEEIIEEPSTPIEAPEIPQCSRKVKYLHAVQDPVLAGGILLISGQDVKSYKQKDDEFYLHSEERLEYSLCGDIISRSSGGMNWQVRLENNQPVQVQAIQSGELVENVEMIYQDERLLQLRVNDTQLFYFIYDAQGFCIEKRGFGIFGDREILSSMVRYLPDKENRLFQEIEFNLDGSEFSKKEYIYDEQGRIIRTLTERNGVVLRIEILYYSEEGYLNRIEVFDSIGRLLHYREIQAQAWINTF